MQIVENNGGGNRVPHVVEHAAWIAAFTCLTGNTAGCLFELVCTAMIFSLIVCISDGHKHDITCVCGFKMWSCACADVGWCFVRASAC